MIPEAALISHWLCGPFTFLSQVTWNSTEVDTEYVPGTLHNFLPVGDQKEKVSQVKQCHVVEVSHNTFQPLG